jgi:hypothetical protein
MHWESTIKYSGLGSRLTEYLKSVARFGRVKTQDLARLRYQNTDAQDSTFR